MATGYQYKSLNRERQEVRLLCFAADDAPHTGFSKEPLKCTIKHLSTLIEPLPEYYAISYTWGDSQRRGTILVGGKPITVPLNAEIALRYLLTSKQREKATAPPVLLDATILAESPVDVKSPAAPDWPETEIRFWIDSICINQHDFDEKSWQLLLISDIFSQARATLIWLGDDRDKGSEAAINSISCVVDRCRDETNNLEDLFDTIWAVSPRELSPRSFKQPLPLEIDLAALQTFYSSPWFQRLWALQESVLATRPICYRGSHSISYYDVTLAARWIWYRTFGRLSPEDNQYTNHTIGIQNASSMWDMISTSFIVPRVLSNLVLLGMRFDTTDPRDHIYAILGLLNDGDFANLRVELLPDYAVSLSELYTRTTRTIIRDTQSLFILKVGSTLIRGDKRSEDAMYMPSWVPRYDWMYDVNKGSPCAIRGIGKGACSNFKMRFRPWNGITSVLTVQGVLVDQIEHLATPWEPTKYGAEALKQQIVDTWAMTTSYGSKVLYDSLETAYAATICAGRNKYLQDITQDAQFNVNCAAFFRSCGYPCKQLASTLR